MSRRLKISSSQITRSVTKKKKTARVDAAITAGNMKPVAPKKEKMILYVNKKALRRGKNTNRSGCRELDFSAFPITGTHISVGVEKMIRDRKRHLESAELKQLVPLLAVASTAPLNYVVKEDGTRAYYSEEEYKKMVNEWRLRHMANLARTDKPADLSRNEPKTGAMWIDKPTGNKANGKMPKAEFDKAEPIVSLDLKGTLKLKAVIAEAKIKEANSHLREIPLALCMWLISVQEGWDMETKKQYNIISDKKAAELTDKLHGKK